MNTIDYLSLTALRLLVSGFLSMGWKIMSSSVRYHFVELVFILFNDNQYYEERRHPFQRGKSTKLPIIPQSTLTIPIVFGPAIRRPD